MAFFVEQPKSYDSGSESYTFKQGVKYSYFKTDDKRPITFRILPAFDEHEAGTSVEQLPGGKMNWVRAVTLQGGNPVVADWVFRLKMSRSYIKGSSPVISRRTLVERNADGSLVEQDDPLSRVIEFCRQNKGDWGYVVEDQGNWGDPNRVLAKLPRISDQYLLNVVTYDDERPGAKLAVISSFPAIMDLCGGKEGQEGFALRQTQREVSDEEFRSNPSAIFEFGDITDPNSAPVFRFVKTIEGRQAYHVVTMVEKDPSTGRQRIRRDPVFEEDMLARVDLAHPETYINIPTPEEQVAQIVRVCSGRNAHGMHESEMLRAALPEYRHLIPVIGSGAAKPAQQTPPTPSTPSTPSAPPPPTQQFSTPAFTQTQPRFSQPAPAPTKHIVAPAMKAAVAVASAAKPSADSQQRQGIPGEETFVAEDWVSQYGGK